MIKVNQALIISLIGIGLVGWFSSETLNDVYRDNANLRNEITLLQSKVDSLLTGSVNGVSVIATIYHAEKRQTDSTPHITADGTRIDTRNAGKYRFIAVSRDLLSRWGGNLNYGDYVIISNTDGKFNGVWQVKDTMNKRFTNRIDFLCSRGQKIAKFNNAKIYKVKLEDFVEINRRS